MVLNEKLTKNWKLRGLKLRGLRQNQISTANFRYENGQCIKINTLSDFEMKNRPHKKVMPIFNPGIQPISDTFMMVLKS